MKGKFDIHLAVWQHAAQFRKASLSEVHGTNQEDRMVTKTDETPLTELLKRDVRELVRDGMSMEVIRLYRRNGVTTIGQLYDNVFNMTGGRQPEIGAGCIQSATNALHATGFTDRIGLRWTYEVVAEEAAAHARSMAVAGFSQTLDATIAQIDAKHADEITAARNEGNLRLENLRSDYERYIGCAVEAVKSSLARVGVFDTQREASWLTAHKLSEAFAFPDRELAYVDIDGELHVEDKHLGLVRTAAHVRIKSREFASAMSDVSRASAREGDLIIGRSNEIDLSAVRAPNSRVAIAFELNEAHHLLMRVRFLQTDDLIDRDFELWRNNVISRSE